MMQKDEKVTIGLRLVSMLVDHFAMTFIVMLITLPGFIFQMINSFNLDHEPMNLNFGIITFFMLFGFTAYFNKDIFNGRSPAKRILKFQVIDIKTELVASPTKCFIRNLTIIFWPIEVIFVIINPQRRIGDYISGTKIQFIENPEKTKINWKSFLPPILIAFAFTFLLSIPFSFLNSTLTPKKVDFIKESFNEIKSKNANEVFELELEGLIRKADFRIYDRINNDSRKYVSAILYFENEEDYEYFDKSEKRISKLIKTEFPLDYNYCFIKFVFKESGKMSTRQKTYYRDDNDDKASS